MSGRYWIVQGITVVRLPIAVLFAVLLPYADLNSPAALWGLAGLLLVGEVTDALDGILARRWKVQSEFGAMLDPYADSVSRIIVYWSLGEAGLALTIVALVMAVRDVTVAYCRIRLVQGNRSVKANISGKIKAVVQCVAAFCLLLSPLLGSGQPQRMQVFSWIVVAATAASSVQYVQSAVGSSGSTTEP